MQPRETRFQKSQRRPWAVILGVILAMISLACPIPSAVEHPPSLHNTSDWPSYGNDKGGMRYATVTQITPANVSRLKVAWIYRSGDYSDGTDPEIPSATAFEATPILVNKRLVFCTPFNRVIALDPLTGIPVWSFDPKIDLKARYENQLVCRGVSAWTDTTSPEGQACRTRIFTGTNDGRLFAIDAETGTPCSDFADKGHYNLRADVGLLRWGGEYQVTSPPAIIGDRVVVGSAIADNQHIDAPSGVVRAFDARSGKLLWAQDLAPPDYTGPRSPAGYALGTPNVWSIMSVDEKLGLIYLPTGNPAPDFFRGNLRGSIDYYGSSVVALRADSGAVAWRFQTVHHDLWDYDVPAQPVLFTLRKDDGTTVPALAQATKTGHLFILDRTTGEPVFGVTEKPVPQSGVPGEILSPTQPVPNRPPPLARQSLRPEETDVRTGVGRRCRDLLEGMRSEGIFTPPSFRGTVLLPGSGGGLNWSGVGIDPERQILITNSTDVAWAMRLFPGDRFPEEHRANPKGEVRPQDGTPFGMSRSFFTEKFALFFDVPCNPSPWGHLNAINLRNGEIMWRKPLGRAFGRDGLPSLGGAILTSTGLAFIAGTIRDDTIRAFDVMTGEEKWKHSLPAGGQATPMTYEVELQGGRRRQFVVIAAGGNPRGTSNPGDSLVAFSLPE